MRSAPELLACAQGIDCRGDEPCIYCGAPADVPHAIPGSFTARDTLSSPGSSSICRGCVIATEEQGTASYPDGSTKAWSRAFRRCHSWTMTKSASVPYFPGHVPHLRRFLLAPPPPPWAACIVGPTNGRQLIYLTPVTRSPGYGSVMLEGERVDYRQDDFAPRLRMALRLASVGGKPALSEPPSVSLASAALSLPDGERLMLEWQRVHSEPLSRLAVFLTPKKDDCPHAIGELTSAAR